ncbi:hypothetical protein RCOM_0634810 [Ricinus communis]|uniref:Uncharacterized protein n=1 Tax=Ricinus communis TaxID=3988 RepID=B9S186_RICCO|nr:hypothetical protein RCOM_0634810 [Ricinus communis]|eukprot:XP_015575006.1 origin recognition complex subunit 1 isoform X1 [Ricinus communis]
MPSGAKRRKAAKKKKEQQTNNNTNTNSSSTINRNNDPKSQDERDSDGGEVGSPASQDHHNQEHPFNEDNEESEKRDHSTFVSDYKPVEGVTSDAQGSQNVGVEDDSVVKIERELNSELDIESKDVGVEHVESAKESHDGDDKSSSSSSSDDESRTFEKKWKEEDCNSALDAASCNTVEKVFPEEVTRDSNIEQSLEEANGNSTVETDPTNDLAAPQVLMSEVAKHTMEGAEVENPEILDVIEPGLKESEDKLLPKSNDVIAGLVPEKNENKAFPIVDENVGASTTLIISDVNGNEGKISDAHTETTICAERTKDSETLGGAVIGNVGKSLTSFGAHVSEACNDAIKVRDYETSEYAENQPLVPPAQRVTQRTSWMSCCGLFDVFIGSNR